MVDIFRALAEESRLRILALLIQDELCVCEIEECLNMTQSNVSRHLTVLRKCGILESYKKAQWAYFKVSDKFKCEHQNLWLYLIHNLKESPDYQIDFVKCQICKDQDLCNY
jgi:ArsR family transcriptional regulator